MLNLLARSNKDDGMLCGRKERLWKSPRKNYVRSPNRPKSMHELSEITLISFMGIGSRMKTDLTVGSAQRVDLVFFLIHRFRVPGGAPSPDPGFG